MSKWNQEDLESEYLKPKVQESQQLDYKGAGSLDTKDEKKKEEITRDVSSFANAAGGIIIYGIKERKERKKAVHS